MQFSKIQSRTYLRTYNVKKQTIRFNINITITSKTKYTRVIARDNNCNYIYFLIFFNCIALYLLYQIDHAIFKATRLIKNNKNKNKDKDKNKDNDKTNCKNKIKIYNIKIFKY